MKRTVSIKVNLLTYFLIIIFLVSGVVIGMQYYFSTKLANDAAEGYFREVAEQASMFSQKLSEQILHQLAILAARDDLLNTGLMTAQADAIEMMTGLLESAPELYSAYIGQKNDNFFQLINLNIDASLHERYQVSQQARWLLVRITNTDQGRIKYIDALDEKLQPLGRQSETSNYYPSSRPWYEKASLSRESIVTDIYNFTGIKGKGITYARQQNDGSGIFGMDLSLQSLRNFLSSQANKGINELFLFDHQGFKYLSSSENYDVDPATSKSEAVNSMSGRPPALVAPEIDKVAATRQPALVKYTDNSIEKLTYLYPLDGFFINGHTVGVTADQDFLMAPYLKQVKNSIYMAFAVIIFAILLVLYLTRRLTRPIEALMLEKQKIQQRKFDQVAVVKTHITEFLSLSNSMINMSDNIRDYQKMQETLMDSFLKLIAGAIDTKSPYTGGHCERVPEIAMMLAEAACQSDRGEMAKFNFDNDDQWREFRIGSWLHDCGKVTTPEYVVDKATKLETINNRIHEIRTRFEVIWRDLEITATERKLNRENAAEVDQWLQTEQHQLQQDFAFVAECNIGGEFMSDDKIERLQNIAARQWQRYFSNRLGLSEIEKQRFIDEEQNLPATESLLSNKPEHIIPRENFDLQEYHQQGFKLDVPDNLYNRGELYNLSVRRGTLTEEERFKINDHVIQTIRMLEKLPFPDNMQRVVEYAGTHHETLNGKGYPRKLSADELSLPARIMAIADIFEALTASDRPYKKAKTLSEAIKIMTFMVKDEHIDKDLFELFLRSGVYQQYAESTLLAEQLDEVDIEAMLA